MPRLAIDAHREVTARYGDRNRSLNASQGNTRQRNFYGSAARRLPECRLSDGKRCPIHGTTFGYPVALITKSATILNRNQRT